VGLPLPVGDAQVPQRKIDDIGPWFRGFARRARMAISVRGYPLTWCGPRPETVKNL
jgi:hypothetical protein